LADVIPVPPLRAAISVGDIFLAAGIVLLVASLMILRPDDGAVAVAKDTRGGGASARPSSPGPPSAPRYVEEPTSL
jgi:hypothetical protein